MNPEQGAQAPGLVNHRCGMRRQEDVGGLVESVRGATGMGGGHNLKTLKRNLVEQEVDIESKEVLLKTGGYFTVESLLCKLGVMIALAQVSSKRIQDSVG